MYSQNQIDLFTLEYEKISDNLELKRQELEDEKIKYEELVGKMNNAQSEIDILSVKIDDLYMKIKDDEEEYAEKKTEQLERGMIGIGIVLSLLLAGGTSLMFGGFSHILKFIYLSIISFSVVSAVLEIIYLVCIKKYFDKKIDEYRESSLYLDVKKEIDSLLCLRKQKLNDWNNSIECKEYHNTLANVLAIGNDITSLEKELEELKVRVFDYLVINNCVIKDSEDRELPLKRVKRLGN